MAKMVKSENREVKNLTAKLDERKNKTTEQNLDLMYAYYARKEREQAKLEERKNVEPSEAWSANEIEHYENDKCSLTNPSHVAWLNEIGVFDEKLGKIVKAGSMEKVEDIRPDLAMHYHRQLVEVFEEFIENLPDAQRNGLRDIFNAANLFSFGLGINEVNKENREKLSSMMQTSFQLAKSDMDENDQISEFLSTR